MALICNMIVQQFTFNPFQENTYVISDENGKCAIVDPGCCDPGERYELEQHIENEQLQVTHLLNTHCHLDHIYGNAFVGSKWNVPLHLHELEVPILQMAEQSAMVYSLPIPDIGPQEQIFYNMEEPLMVGSLKLDLLFVPGHAPGHVAFYHADSKNLIAGDVLFNGSIGRSDLPMGDHQQLIDSITREFYKLPDETTVWPGHGPKTTIGHERRTNPFVKG